MLHLLITILVFAGLTVAIITANVFISALLIGVADTCFKRAQAVTSANTGKSAAQHHNIPGDQL